MSGKIKGAVLVNAYQRLEEAMYQPRRMSEELTALGVETAPRIRTVRVELPPARKAGVMVSSVAELVDKLKNEARVI